MHGIEGKDGLKRVGYSKLSVSNFQYFYYRLPSACVVYNDHTFGAFLTLPNVFMFKLCPLIQTETARLYNGTPR